MEPAQEQRNQSKESWSGWFSLAIRSGDFAEFLSLYESRPDGALEYWQQNHVAPEWALQLITRWEAYKTRKQSGYVIQPDQPIQSDTTGAANE